MSPESTQMLLTPLLIDLLDLRRRELERHRAKVIAQALFFTGSGDGNDVLVDAVPEKDLSRIDSVLLCQAIEQLFGWTAGAFGYGREGPVGCCCDALHQVSFT